MAPVGWRVPDAGWVGIVGQCPARGRLRASWALLWPATRTRHRPHGRSRAAV